MATEPIDGVKSQKFRNRVDPVFERTGEPPQRLRFTLDVSYEASRDFFAKHEMDNLYDKFTGGKIHLHDLMENLLWAYSRGLKIDFSQNLFNQIRPGWTFTKNITPKTAVGRPRIKEKKIKNPNETRGRKPRAPESLFKSDTDISNTNQGRSA